ncbi:hypothetical protein ACFPM0_31890 [Pseudonocardia sulfidoxydans]
MRPTRSAEVAAHHPRATSLLFLRPPAALRLRAVCQLRNRAL